MAKFTTPVVGTDKASHIHYPVRYSRHLSRVDTIVTLQLVNRDMEVQKGPLTASSSQSNNYAGVGICLLVSDPDTATILQWYYLVSFQGWPFACCLRRTIFCL